MSPKIECSDEYLEVLIGCVDQLSKVIKGFYSIDVLLNNLLVNKIQNSSSLELNRVSFLLKFDMSCGLGILTKEIRPCFNNINSIRNKFAHNPYFFYDKVEQEKTKSIFLQVQNFKRNDVIKNIDDPDEMLKIAFFLCYLMVENGLKEIYREKQAWNIVNNRMAKFLNPPGNAESSKKLDAEIEASLKIEYPKLFKC